MYFRRDDTRWQPVRVVLQNREGLGVGGVFGIPNGVASSCVVGFERLLAYNMSRVGGWLANKGARGIHVGASTTTRHSQPQGLRLELGQSTARGRAGHVR